jgi:adenosylcobyric acid synthase
VLGVLPMWRDHGLPDEDGLPPPHGMPPAAPPGIRVLAVLAGPHLSNLDEFEPLAHVPGLQLRWVRHPDQLAGAHWLVLPGSKQVSGDLAWLRATGLDRAVAAHAAAGGPVLGLCGGLQMLGALLADPDGVDGPAHGGLPGLGLLPLETHYAAPKLLRPGRARLAHDLAGPWQALSGLVFDGYEIRCGRSAPLEAAPGLHTPLHQALHADDGRCIGWQHGSVLGLYAHGLFESPAVLHALFGAAGAALEPRLDALATWAEQHLGADTLQRLLGPGAKP